MADTLKSHRERARLTQEGLAHAAGVSVMHISRIERGIANPTVATLCALADVLQIRPSELVPE